MLLLSQPNLVSGHLLVICLGLFVIKIVVFVSPVLDAVRWVAGRPKLVCKCLLQLYPELLTFGPGLTWCNHKCMTGDLVAEWLEQSRSHEFDFWPVCCQVIILGSLFIPMCLCQVCAMFLCHQAVHFASSQGVVMLCGWEGNHRFGVALAMRHRLCGLYTVVHKKTCHFIFDHNSHVSWWIFTLVVPMETGINLLTQEQK